MVSKLGQTKIMQMDIASRDCGKKRGQTKIMQMSFMIIGVFFFFVLVGLFVLNIFLNDVGKGAESLAREQAISSLGIIAGLPELSYNARDSMVVDEDKIRVLSRGFGDNMSEFWPVASIEVYKLSKNSEPLPALDNIVRCPANDCNYYSVYDSKQESSEKFSSYVSVCKRSRESGSVYDSCSVGKLVVGMKIRGETGQ